MHRLQAIGESLNIASKMDILLARFRALLPFVRIGYGSKTITSEAGNNGQHIRDWPLSV